jgi:hypothetical protein
MQCRRPTTVWRTFCRARIPRTPTAVPTTPRRSLPAPSILAASRLPPPRSFHPRDEPPPAPCNLGDPSRNPAAAPRVHPAAARRCISPPRSLKSRGSEQKSRSRPTPTRASRSSAAPLNPKPTRRHQRSPCHALEAHSRLPLQSLPRMPHNPNRRSFASSNLSRAAGPGASAWAASMGPSHSGLCAAAAACRARACPRNGTTTRRYGGRTGR